MFQQPARPQTLLRAENSCPAGRFRRSSQQSACHLGNVGSHQAASHLGSFGGNSRAFGGCWMQTESTSRLFLVFILIAIYPFFLSRVEAQEFTLRWTPSDSSVNERCYTACRRYFHTHYQYLMDRHLNNRGLGSLGQPPEISIRNCNSACSRRNNTPDKIEEFTRLWEQEQLRVYNNWLNFTRQTPNGRTFGCIPLDATCISSVCSNAPRC